MAIIICFFIFVFLALPLGAAINDHKIKVRRRQNIEDMREAMTPCEKPPAVASQAVAKYVMYGAQR